mmetsp:Transcript_23255/g.50849  ORF Transcript_23255/g.50849 Transcript_23255/m.50849 type:complete len:239 (+) Transcript_23255:30-746(+)
MHVSRPWADAHIRNMLAGEQQGSDISAMPTFGLVWWLHRLSHDGSFQFQGASSVLSHQLRATAVARRLPAARPTSNLATSSILSKSRLLDADAVLRLRARTNCACPLPAPSVGLPAGASGSRHPLSASSSQRPCAASAKQKVRLPSMPRMETGVSLSSTSASAASVEYSARSSAPSNVKTSSRWRVYQSHTTFTSAVRAVWKGIGVLIVMYLDESAAPSNARLFILRTRPRYHSIRPR